MLIQAAAVYHADFGTDSTDKTERWLKKIADHYIK